MLQKCRWKMKNKLIVVTGQTATGKTTLAIDYSKRQSGEIVNADSRQVYKKLDIVTGKDLKTLIVSKIPLHLFDIVDPKKDFSSFEYVQKAQTVIKDIVERGSIPIIVGGSYFYIQHLLYGHDTEGVRADWELRKDLNKKTAMELQKILTQLVNRSRQENKMNQSDWNNPRRLIRRIEILSSISDSKTDVPTSALIDKYEITILGLRFKDKENLIKKVTERVHSRLKEGAIDEVRNLLKTNHATDDPGLKTIGYKQLIKYLLGNGTQEEAVNEWILKEVQYAKRQYTFMKKDKLIVWQNV